MLERYTEQARRTIFFGRYEASQFGSPLIETEHLLLGLLREDKALTHRFLPSHVTVKSIREQIEGRTLVREKISTSVDLPLTDESKRVLKHAATEGHRLRHTHIGTEHLLLGLLCEERCFAAELLREQGLKVEQLREEFAKASWSFEAWRARLNLHHLPLEIHGCTMDFESVRRRVNSFRKFRWRWCKSPWTARDLVVDKDGKISFDVSLSADTQNFTLSPGSWKEDRCAVCQWELYESKEKPDHGVGYTNGRDWVCTECYEMFLSAIDFFAITRPEIK